MVRSFFTIKKDFSLSVKEQCFYYLLLAYCISLYIKHAPVVTNLLLFSVFIAAIFIGYGKNYFHALKKNKIISGLLLFFIYQVLSVCTSVNKEAGLQVLLMRLPLFLLPCSFCLVDFDKKIWVKIALFYAFTTTLASIFGFAYGIYMALHMKDTGYLYNDNISELLLDKQAVYFGFYINAALIVFLFSLSELSETQKKMKTMIRLAMFWLVFIVCMLAGKTSMFCLAGILLLICIRYLFVHKKKNGRPVTFI